MILIAASLYLPQHINFLTSRAWFYYHGDDTSTKAAIKSVAPIAANAAVSTATKFKEVVETVMAEGAKAANEAREL